MKERFRIPDADLETSPSLSQENNKTAVRRAVVAKNRFFIYLVSNARTIADEANVYASRQFEVQKEKFIFLLFFNVFSGQIFLFFMFNFRKNAIKFTGPSHSLRQPRYLT